MLWCDKNDNVIEWGSEELSIPYRSPLDNKIHKYYPDFYIKIKDKNDNLKKYIIEVKPKQQTIPPKKRKRVTQSYVNEVKAYMKNEAKWDAAKKYCKECKIDFMILTEEHLKV